VPMWVRSPPPGSHLIMEFAVTKVQIGVLIWVCAVASAIGCWIASYHNPLGIVVSAIGVVNATVLIFKRLSLS
jgi:hypothetical protein